MQIAERDKVIEELNHRIDALERTFSHRVSPAMFGSVLIALSKFISSSELADILCSSLKVETEEKKDEAAK